MERDTKEPRDMVERNIMNRVLWSQERTRMHLITALIIAIVLLTAWGVVETALRHVEQQRWLDFMAGYEFETYEYEQDGQGVNIIGHGNGVTNYEPAPASSEDDT